MSDADLQELVALAHSMTVEGPPGPAGPAGAPGPEGPAGADGAPGPAGPPGEQGPAGGEKGETGPKGDKGDQGVQGQRGIQGEQGPAGLTGAKGDRGPQGLEGVTGPVGPIGAKGDKGERGEHGVAGPVGPAGHPGRDGDRGEQGAPGRDGRDSGRSGSGSGAIQVLDHGVVVGSQVRAVDIRGSATVEVEGSVARVTVTGGAGGSIAVTDGVTTVDPATTLTVPAGSLTDGGSGDAELDFDLAGAAAAAQAASQPLDSDLTAIAALSTTAYGRALLTLANAAAGRTAFGLGTAAVANVGDFDAAGLAAAAFAAAVAASQPVDADLTAIAALTPSNDDIIQRKAGAWTNRTIAQLLTDLGLGTLYQPLDADLTAIAALSTTSYGRAFLVLADAAAARTALALGTAATSATTDFDPAGAAAAVTTTSIGAVPTARTISAGAGLTGGGDLSANRSLAADFGSGAGKVVQGNDSRLSDARTPTAHASSHQAGGSDAIALDTLAAPTDVTTLNASTTAHGLSPKLPNDATKFYNGVGGFTVPAGSGLSAAKVGARVAVGI